MSHTQSEFLIPHRPDTTSQPDVFRRTPDNRTPIYDQINRSFGIGGTPLYTELTIAAGVERKKHARDRTLVNECAKEIDDERTLAIDSVLFIYEQQNKNHRIAAIARQFIANGLGLHMLQSTQSGIPKEPTVDELVEAERSATRSLFAPTTNGYEQSFVYTDQKDWAWIQYKIDDPSVNHTTRFVVQDEQTLKIQDVYLPTGEKTVRHSILVGDELQNFVQSVQMYHTQVMSAVYNNKNVNKFNFTSPHPRA
jgi:hypothetical protein